MDIVKCGPGAQNANSELRGSLPKLENALKFQGWKILEIQQTKLNERTQKYTQTA
jgi:hypothetical protein